MIPEGKIGMCCACGGTFPPSQTIKLSNGLEVCARCAEEMDDEEGEEID